MKSSVHILITMLLMSLIFSTFVGCSVKTKELECLDNAENLITDNPKEALIWLDSIKTPQKLSQKDYMKYLVLNTQAKYKNFQNIEDDTLIFEAIKYYNKHVDDPYQKAIANLYTGCVYSEKDIYSEAMEYFLEAYNNAEHTNNIGLKALIKAETGKMYYKKNLPDSAISYYKESLQLYNQIDESERTQSGLMHLIAINYSMNKDFDEALFYNNKALQLAKQGGDSILEVRIMNSLGIIYREIGNYKASKNMFLNLLSKKSLYASLKYNVYLNLSKTYYYEEDIDSAFYYIDLVRPVVEQKDNYFILGYHKFLYELYAKTGKYAEALEHQKLYHEYHTQITEKERADALLQAEKEYRLSEKEKQLVSSQLQNQIFLSIALGCFLLLAIAVIFIIAFRSKHKRTIQKNKLLNSQVNNILFVNDLYKYITSESNTFEKEVESLTLSYSIKEKSKGYSQIQNMLKNMKKETQQSLRHASLEFLKSKSISNEVISKLNASDMLLISLTQCNYDFKDIAIVLGVNPHALHMRKQRLIEKLKKSGLSDNEIEKIAP